MKKILFAALVAVLSRAAFGQTVVVGTCTSPCTVAKVGLVGQTASISPTTIYTPSVGGTYRISVNLYVTTVGSAGTIQAFASWNDGIAAHNLIGTGSSQSLTGNNTTSGTAIMHVGAGQAIQYSYTVTGATGSPVYAGDVVVEFLQ